MKHNREAFVKYEKAPTPPPPPPPTLIGRFFFLYFVYAHVLENHNFGYLPVDEFGTHHDLSFEPLTKSV